MELIARTAPDDELTLDLDSVTLNGQRYGVDMESARRIEGWNWGKPAHNMSALGGGKGAAIEAAAGTAGRSRTSDHCRSADKRVVRPWQLNCSAMHLLLRPKGAFP